ncbi:glycosyltransferase family 39 protein [Candidatus Pelagibacter communis]|uniref:glycosyltransferase family 39 protein n=1 Tax=Pelagibacter ubique TaxID=198252 RepID=UPI00094C5F9F|nr:glycosyltransferase family 39 protein [Candidatus Pelagibacter ubique]
MIVKKNIFNIYYLFILSHLTLWTLVPTFSNTNLPLDTIEALAWGSNLGWGFDKHPPLSAFAVELFFSIFGSNDWAYYFLSQLFVVVAFIYVWKFSNEILDNKKLALISILVLEGIYFYNFTTPEFNVNISQLPFWAMAVYFFWKSLETNNKSFWFLFGICSALGFLSKYLFVYILFSLFLYLFFNLKKYKKHINNYLFSVIVSLLILSPHFMWLYENNFSTITYGFKRSSLGDSEIVDHLVNPIIFLFNQLIILIPFFIMIFVLLKKVKLLKFKNQKTTFLFTVTFLPIILILLTSLFTGAKIRTMWMTPFYLFFGVFFIEFFKRNIDFKKLKKFFIFFLFFFIFSPMLYLSISLIDKTKRTDYPGREISRLVQNKWDNNFVNEIKIVVGDEWSAGNLSYHLRSRPVWINDLGQKIMNIKDNQGVIYTGNPSILKKICPGVFGTIRPVGYCMIGKK